MMNLYDNDDGFRKFTVKEANELLPEIIRLTDSVIYELEQLKEKLETDSASVEDVVESFERESVEILEDWAKSDCTIWCLSKRLFYYRFQIHCTRYPFVLDLR